MVIQGYAKVLVKATGSHSIHGKIGANISGIEEESTPLQKQTKSLVSFSAKVAGLLFILVLILTYLNSSNPDFKSKITQSVLSGITLAMAMIPEEFPVIFTVFLSMGAWRLARKNSLVRRLSSVETLGAISVLCVDKTGTITENKMSVNSVYTENKTQFDATLLLACETDPYDPMEIAMHEYSNKENLDLEKLYSNTFIKEFAFSNETKMMGHVWSIDNELVLTAKGSPESILSISNLNGAELSQINESIKTLSTNGERVIAVGFQKFDNERDIPSTLGDCNLEYAGIVGLIDPPRDSIEKSIKIAQEAGIRIIMITGDNGDTANAIAKKVGILSEGKSITGLDIKTMSESELQEVVKTTSVFSRVVPEHKMEIIKALKINGEVVAMTGDGVNDAPALKYADIGIAMGKRGSDVAREASDIILLDDNFSTIVDTIEDGRKIYDNIKKAVSYVFTIHIPIALIVLFTSFLGIEYANIMLLPLHIVLLELIIDPTCSIVLERQPAENDIMLRNPRDTKEKLLNKKAITKSVLQGIVIFVVAFGTYLVASSNGNENAQLARTMSFGVIAIANIMLVQVNSSDTISMFKSISKLRKDKVMWVSIVGTFLALIVLIYSPISTILKFVRLSLTELLITIVLGCISVVWYEGIKYKRRKRHNFEDTIQ